MSGSTWNPPVSPTVGELYQFAGATWSWNGSAWVNANTGEYFVTPAAMASAIAAAPQVPQNYVDNSGFTVNQRGYASGAALAAGVYGFDRWRGGASGGTLTFTASPPSTIVTITAGSIAQAIESVVLLGAPYTLSWTGTATGRVGSGNGLSTGAYLASPITFTPTVGSVWTIEFTGGTLGQVQLQLGSVATPWQPQPLAVETVRCQRFYLGATSFTKNDYGAAGNSWNGNLLFPTTMRASPTLTSSSAGGNLNSQSLSATAGWITAAGLVAATGATGWTTTFTASADL